MGGFDCFLKGFRLILTPGLRRYVVVPFIINTLLFIGMIYYAFSSFDDWINGLIVFFLPEFLVDWLFDLISGFLWLMFLVALLGFLFYGFTIVANIIAAPFNAVLATQVEKRLRNGVSDAGDITWYKVLPRALARELSKLIYYLPRLVGLILITLVPLVQVAAPFLWVLFGAWMMTVQYADYAADNNNLTFRELQISMSRNRPQSLMFGLAVYMMMIVPFVNLIVIPAAVAGGTLFWVENLNSGEVQQGSRLSA